MRDNEISIAITGASGACYGIRLLQWLCQANIKVHLMISDAARVVMATEEGLEIAKSPAKQKSTLCDVLDINPELLECWSQNNWASAVASGSSAPSRMVVCPCSTGSLSAIATGASNNLIERAADVVLKERGQLIVVPREAPYSAIHLDNMLKLTQAGAIVLPASPGFYNKPESIADLVDFVVSRILDKLNINNELSGRWGYMSDAEPAGE